MCGFANASQDVLLRKLMEVIEYLLRPGCGGVVVLQYKVYIGLGNLVGNGDYVFVFGG
jgi:hypothetical protein